MVKFKDPYCGLDDYMNGPFSQSIPYDDYFSWAQQATILIDSLTHGRASAHAEALSSELAYACGQIAEILHQSHTGKMAAVSGLAGASNDGYSETYSASGDVTKTTNRICYAILEEALGTDPYGLLYAGVI